MHRGLAALAGANLTFDLLVTANQLPAAIRTVKALPHNQFVVDHLAMPPLTEGSIAQWSSLLRELAAEPNVSAKVSGLVTAADWQSWSVVDLARAVEVALEAFGASRLMFGSDWPVCLLASDYGGVVESVTTLIAELSVDEQAEILGGTCRRFYQLA